MFTYTLRLQIAGEKHLMNTSTYCNIPYLQNKRPWYEAADGTCTIKKPTLINMGDDRPLHLLFPVYWREWLSVLPEANKLARENDGLLILVLYGKISLEQMKLLVLEFTDKIVLPLWVEEENRNKFNCVVALISNKCVDQLCSTKEQSSW